MTTEAPPHLTSSSVLIPDPQVTNPLISDPQAANPCPPTHSSPLSIPLTTTPLNTDPQVSVDALLTPSRDPFNSIRNYVAVVRGDNPTVSDPATSVKSSSTSFFDGVSNIRKIVQPKIISKEEDTAFVNFSSDEVNALSAPFAYILVGKFSNGVPRIAEVAPALLDLKIKGRFEVSFMDYRHIYIRLYTEEDYRNLWLSEMVNIGACPMRMFKWSPDFSPKAKSPIVPVWITLKKVPLYLFYAEALFELVKPIGRPLRVDNHTANLARLDKVRGCVEVDLTKPLLKHICVTALGTSFTLNVHYEDLPGYCSFCARLGHVEENCHVKNPEKKKNKNPDVYEDARDHLMLSELGKRLYK